MACHPKPPMQSRSVFISSDFHLLSHDYVGSRIANTREIIEFLPRELAMLGQLTNIPTDTLIDMLYVIFADAGDITAREVVEIEQIQRELQRRGGAEGTSLQSVH